MAAFLTYSPEDRPPSRRVLTTVSDWLTAPPRPLPLRNRLVAWAFRASAILAATVLVLPFVGSA